MIQQLLAGIGSGGGHLDMAGGRIPNIRDFDQESICKRMSALVKNGKI